jgi:predicted ABC-class ATPase
VSIDAGGQPVLERSAVRIGPDFVEARLQVGLPAAGRRVLGREAEELLAGDLAEIGSRALLHASLSARDARRFVECVENHSALQDQLGAAGLVAFLADGSVLPRESGASERPLRGAAVPLEAPDSLRVELEVPNPVPGPEGKETRRLAGLGLREGVTLVVGGGYHGKTTLLRALERGVHPHVPGDGRELVATRPDAVKIRAEDGRGVVGCDIHAFVSDLPLGRSTHSFTSDDASGSTSQAANIVEALEAGSRTLLLDEDTSATNFMVRDARMQALVHRDHEPITPFVDRVAGLHETLGVSTVLVMGGCGDYFDVADTVIEMNAFLPQDVTERARRLAGDHPTERRSEARASLGPVTSRVPLASSLDPSKGRRDVRIDVRGDSLGFGRETVDLRCVEQLVDPSQIRAIGHALVLAQERLMGEKRSLAQVLDALEALLDEERIDVLSSHPADLARPRRFEIAAALNRLRTLRVEQGD